MPMAPKASANTPRNSQTSRRVNSDWPDWPAFSAMPMTMPATEAKTRPTMAVEPRSTPRPVSMPKPVAA